MHRHLVVLAAFLVEAEPPALALGEVVLDPHRKRGADPREAVDQHADQRAIAQANQAVGGDALEQLARFFWARIGVLPRLTTCSGPRTTEAGLLRTTWPTTSQSNSMRTAARCCLTEGAAWVLPRCST